ncbi:g8472 [Coccomyxa viridis]|uniref:G8472 protein n=1 Tax=Coccomyxa viridis TaxID=1274662 RepID=A0ABP1G749_9CHLO
MVVLRRAMKGGTQAALAAALTLTSNNPATQPLLDMLLDYGLLCLHSASQAVQGSKLPATEVFIRSMQCNTSNTGLKIAEMRWMTPEQQRREGRMMIGPRWC